MNGTERSQLNAVFYGRNGTLSLVARCVGVRSDGVRERRLRRGLDGAERAGALLGLGRKPGGAWRASIMALMVRASRARGNSLVRPRSKGRGATAVEQQDAADEPLARMEARR